MCDTGGRVGRQAYAGARRAFGQRRRRAWQTAAALRYAPANNANALAPRCAPATRARFRAAAKRRFAARTALPHKYLLWEPVPLFTRSAETRQKRRRVTLFWRHGERAGAVCGCHLASSGL